MCTQSTSIEADVALSGRPVSASPELIARPNHMGLVKTLRVTVPCKTPSTRKRSRPGVHSQVKTWKAVAKLPDAVNPVLEPSIPWLGNRTWFFVGEGDSKISTWAALGAVVLGHRIA